MEIDGELQNLIDEYVKQVESKEDDLVGLKRNIDGIISVAERDLKDTEKALDKKFDSNQISEAEYLAQFREEKEKVIQRTKEKLDALLAKYEKLHA